MGPARLSSPDCVVLETSCGPMGDLCRAEFAHAPGYGDGSP